MGKDCPSETACRMRVPALGENQKSEIRTSMNGEQIFLIADESTISGDRYFNILVGSVNNPSKTFLMECIVLQNSVTGEVVCQLIDDAIRYLGTPRGNFLLLLSDAASYMISAGSVLKNMYPNLFHVTCIAHLLHNCAMKVRTNSPAVDELIARIKATVTKNATRRELFCEIGQPPEPVVTRWATWLESGLWYAEHLHEVRNIIDNCDGTGLILNRAKAAVADERLTQELIDLVKYRSLIALIKNAESSTYTIRAAMSDLNSLSFGNDPYKIRPYLDARIARNDITRIISHLRTDISPLTYSLLENCQPTSSAVERSFSILKHMLRDDRHFLPKNLANYAMLTFNNN